MKGGKREKNEEGVDAASVAYHVLHKLPSGDSPYVRAKHLQLVEKDPNGAIVFFWKAINEGDRVDSALKDMAVVMKQQDRSEEAIEVIRSFRERCSKQAQESLDNVLIDLYKLVEKDPNGAIVFFWKAINEGDRVDSALKDMAVVMKQQDRSEEAIEVIRSFRERCSKQAQESLDNVLIDLYKKCGKLEEQIELLKQKLRMIYQGEAFNGKPTKTARSHGRKFQVTVKQETSRILGNLGWAYLQLKNFAAAEAVYRKAQEIDPDANKACNLCLCLVKQGRYIEASAVLLEVMEGKLVGSSDPKLMSRTNELVQELEPWRLAQVHPGPSQGVVSLEDAFIEGLDQLINEWTPLRSRRLPVFEEIEISTYRDQLAC